MNNASSSNRKVILLVEDNPTDELLTIRALEKSREPAEIVVTRNGAEALDYIFGMGAYAGRNVNQLPSFILLDLKLPKVSGLNVLKKIRADARTSWVPVIILTSSDEEKDMMECYKTGANSFVQKPINFEEFVKTAEQLGIYWLSLNRIPDTE